MSEWVEVGGLCVGEGEFERDEEKPFRELGICDMSLDHLVSELCADEATYLSEVRQAEGQLGSPGLLPEPTLVLTWLYGGCEPTEIQLPSGGCLFLPVTTQYFMALEITSITRKLT